MTAMYKNFRYLLVLMFGFLLTTTAQAQTDISATATIGNATSITVDDIEFGSFTPDGSSNLSVGITDAGSGEFLIEGNTNVATIAFSSEPALSDGSNSISMDWSAYYEAGNSLTRNTGGTSWSDLTSSQDLSTTLGSNVDLTAEDFYIWVAGTSSSAVPINQPAGAYSATLSLTVTYE